MAEKPSSDTTTDTARRPQGNEQGESREKQPGQDKHTRQTGRFGADEPDYGRPHGDKPNPGKGGRANPQGPEFEQGGSYPGARQSSETDAASTGSSEPRGDRKRG